MEGRLLFLSVFLLAANLFLFALLWDAQRRWRRALARAREAERTLADIFDTSGAGMTLAREIERGKLGSMTKSDWERQIDANKHPLPLQETDR